jgi:hypothetical protein
MARILPSPNDFRRRIATKSASAAPAYEAPADRSLRRTAKGFEIANQGLSALQRMGQLVSQGLVVNRAVHDDPFFGGAAERGREGAQQEKADTYEAETSALAQQREQAVAAEQAKMRVAQEQAALQAQVPPVASMQPQGVYQRTTEHQPGRPSVAPEVLQAAGVQQPQPVAQPAPTQPAAPPAAPAPKPVSTQLIELLNRGQAMVNGQMIQLSPEQTARMQFRVKALVQTNGTYDPVTGETWKPYFEQPEPQDVTLPERLPTDAGIVADLAGQPMSDEDFNRLYQHAEFTDFPQEAKFGTTRSALRTYKLGLLKSRRDGQAARVDAAVKRASMQKDIGAGEASIAAARVKTEKAPHEIWKIDSETALNYARAQKVSLEIMKMMRRGGGGGGLKYNVADQTAARKLSDLRALAMTPHRPADYEAQEAAYLAAPMSNGKETLGDVDAKAWKKYLNVGTTPASTSRPAARSGWDVLTGAILGDAKGERAKAEAAAIAAGEKIDKLKTERDTKGKAFDAAIAAAAGGLDADGNLVEGKSFSGNTVSDQLPNHQGIADPASVAAAARALKAEVDGLDRKIEGLSAERAGYVQSEEELARARRAALSGDAPPEEAGKATRKSRNRRLKKPE